MKMGFISNLYEPNIIGGAETVAQLIAEEIEQKTDHEVFVITSLINDDDAREEKINGVKVYRIDPKNIYPTTEAKNQSKWKKPVWHVMDFWKHGVDRAVEKIVEYEKPDVVNVHNIAGLSTAVWNYANKANIPIVQTLHDYGMLCPKTTLLRKGGSHCDNAPLPCQIRRKAYKEVANKNVDYVISPSRFVLDKYEENGFFSATPKQVIRNANLFTPNNTTKKPIHDGVHFLYAGQVSKHKGIFDLIQSFMKLNGEHLTLTIVGKGEDYEAAKEMTKVDHRIVFKGFVNGKAKEEVFENHHYMMVPSKWYDNSPMVIYEAYSYGIPVIGANIGGIPELIEAESTGYLFESGSQTELVETIKKVEQNHNHYEEMSQRCYEKSKEYSLTKQVNSYLTIFQEVSGQNA